MLGNRPDIPLGGQLPIDHKGVHIVLDVSCRRTITDQSVECIQIVSKFLNGPLHEVNNYSRHKLSSTHSGIMVSKNNPLGTEAEVLRQSSTYNIFTVLDDVATCFERHVSFVVF